MPEYQPTTATNEEQLQLLLECFRDFEILTLDAGGFVVSWTANGEDAQDLHAEDVIGKHHSIFYSPEDISCNKPVQELEIAKTTGRCKVRGWRFRRDGSSCWADVVTTALWNPDASLRGYARIIRNITENRTEEALRASKERYRFLFEKNLAAVALTTPEGKVLNCNESMARVLGFQSLEEALKYRPLDFYVEPGDRDEMIRQLRQKGMLRDRHKITFTFVRRDRAAIWCSSTPGLCDGAGD
jgi:PAS domain S-box-containing protein